LDKRRPTLVFLLIVTAIALAFCFILFRPFIYPLLSALIIGIVFSPVHSRIQRWVRWPGLAASISTLLVMLVVAVPAALILLALIREVTTLREVIELQSADIGLSAYVAGLIERPLRWLSQYVDMSGFDLRASLLTRLKELSGFLVAQSFSLVGGITSFIVNSVIVLFTLFFIFREGKAMKRRLAAILPLNSIQVEKLFRGIENTIAGTVYGGLVVAAVQGALVGLALAVCGIESPVLWGVVAAFFALLPLVGTAAVWVPASLYLLLSGFWVKGIMLIVWGALVVGLVDNILRPLLIQGRVQMHTLLVFFAVFGGINVFGFLGLIIGPVIVAVTLTLLELLRDEGRVWVTALRASQEAGPQPPEAELTP
jgi:predicted PurR-regulated permease PerM